MKILCFVNMLFRHFIFQKKRDTSNINIIELKIIIKYFLKILKYYSKNKKYINKNTFRIFNSMLNNRKQNIPMNYITGQQEFYIKNFFINKNVLIPRSDTEFLIDVLLFYIKKDKIKLFELGTGSSIISTILNKKRPNWNINISDISENALNIAIYNIKNYIKKKISKKNWFLSRELDIIFTKTINWEN